MMDENDVDPDVVELLEADRELTEHERGQLQRLGQRGWVGLQALLHGRARAVYAVAAPEDFAFCTQSHMSESDRQEMIGAEVYQCPGCGRLLKDRKTGIATSILLERGRLRELWLDVEGAHDEEYPSAMARFRRALGLAREATA